MNGLGCLLELLFSRLGAFLGWLALLPVSLLVATPWVLVAALFGPAGYGEKVRAGYRTVYRWWEDVADRSPARQV